MRFVVERLASFGATACGLQFVTRSGFVFGMHMTPSAGANPREAQELEARLSALSAEISACLDAILLEIRNAPHDQRAIEVARDLVATQYSVTQQLVVMSIGRRNAPPALASPSPAEAPPSRLLSAPSQAATPAASTQLHRAEPNVSYHPYAAPPPQRAATGGTPSLLELLQQNLAAGPAATPLRPAASHRPSHAQAWPAQTPSSAIDLTPADLPNTYEVYPPSLPVAPAPEHYAHAPAAPASLIAETSGATPSPPRTLPSSRATKDLPHWAKPASHSVILSTPLRAGLVLLAMVAGLSVMLKAGHKVQTSPSEAQEHAVAELERPSPKANGKLMAKPDASAREEPSASQTAPPQPAPPPIDAGFAPSAQARETQPEEIAANRKSAEPATAEPPARTLRTVPGTALMPDEPESAPPPRKAEAKPPQETGAVAPVARKQTAPAETQAAAVKPPKPVKPEPAAAPAFQTAVVAEKPKELFVPVLLELKKTDSLQMIFDDLKRRHPAVLGSRKAEFRAVAGPNNETWYALMASPAVSKDEAQAVCRDLGAEGQTLGCRVSRY